MKYSENYFPLFDLKDLRAILYPSKSSKQPSSLLKPGFDTANWLRSAPSDPISRISSDTKPDVLQFPFLTSENTTDAEKEWYSYAVKYILHMRRRVVFLSVHFAGLLELCSNPDSKISNDHELNNKLSGLMGNGRNDLKKYIRKKLLIRLLLEKDTLHWMNERNAALAEHCEYPWKALAEFVEHKKEYLLKEWCSVITDDDSAVLAQRLYLPLLDEIASCLPERGNTLSSDRLGKGLTLLFLTAMLGVNILNLMPYAVSEWHTDKSLEVLPIWETEHLFLPDKNNGFSMTQPRNNEMQYKYINSFLQNVANIGIIGGSSLLLLGIIGDSIEDSDSDPYTLEMASDIYYYGILNENSDNYRKAYLCSKKSYELSKSVGLPVGTSAFNLGYYYYLQVYGSPDDRRIIQSMYLPNEQDPVQISMEYFAEAAANNHPSAINSLGNHAQMLLRNHNNETSYSDIDRLHLKFLSSIAYKLAQDKGLRTYATYKSLQVQDLTSATLITSHMYQKICDFCTEVFYEKAASLGGMHGMNNYCRFLTKKSTEEIMNHGNSIEGLSTNYSFINMKTNLLKIMQTLAEVYHYPRAMTDYALCMIRKQNILMKSMDGLEPFTDLIHEIDLCYQKYDPQSKQRVANILAIKRNEQSAENLLKAAVSYTMPQLQSFYSYYAYALFLFGKKKFRDAYSISDQAWILVSKEPNYENYKDTGKTSHAIMKDFLTLLQLRCVIEVPEEIGLTKSQYLRRTEPMETIRYFRSFSRSDSIDATSFDKAFCQILKNLLNNEVDSVSNNIRIPYVSYELESAKFWFDLNILSQDNTVLATQEQIHAMNLKAFNTTKCMMHDIFNYEVSHHSPERELKVIRTYRQTVFSKMELGNINAKWKTAVINNTRDAQALDGLNGFRWGIASKKVTIRSLPAEANGSSLQDEDLCIAELQEGDPFIGFLCTKDRNYLWVHTTCTEGWIPESAALFYDTAENWRNALRLHPTALTLGNLLETMFTNYGSPYKWASGTDCSGFVREVYKEFGLLLPSNTTRQMEYPSRKYILKGLSDNKKLEIIRALPAGAILYMPQHAMLYLGNLNNHQYVISSLNNYYDLSHTLQHPSRITVSTLDLLRTNGESWLTSLTTAIVPWEEK